MPTPSPHVQDSAYSATEVGCSEFKIPELGESEEGDPMEPQPGPPSSWALRACGGERTVTYTSDGSFGPCLGPENDGLTLPSDAGSCKEGKVAKKKKKVKVAKKTTKVNVAQMKKTNKVTKTEKRRMRDMRQRHRRGVATETTEDQVNKRKKINKKRRERKRKNQENVKRWEAEYYEAKKKGDKNTNTLTWPPPPVPVYHKLWQNPPRSSPWQSPTTLWLSA